MPIPWAAIATLGSGLLGGLFGGGDQEIPREQKQLFDAQRQNIDVETALQKLMLARKQAQDPLWRAVQQMAASRLPIFAQQGMNFDFSQPVGGKPPLPRNTRPRDDREPVGRAVPRV